MLKSYKRVPRNAARARILYPTLSSWQLPTGLTLKLATGHLSGALR